MYRLEALICGDKGAHIYRQDSVPYIFLFMPIDLYTILTRDAMDVRVDIYIYGIQLTIYNTSDGIYMYPYIYGWNIHETSIHVELVYICISTLAAVLLENVVLCLLIRLATSASLAHERACDTDASTAAMSCLGVRGAVRPHIRHRM